MDATALSADTKSLGSRGHSIKQKLIKLVDKTLERTAESNAMAVATVAAPSDENKMIDADANILLIPRNRLRKPIKSTELYTTNGSKIYARIHSQTLYLRLP